MVVFIFVCTVQESGLSKFLGQLLKVFTPTWVNTAVVALLVSLLTEITSNAAVVNVVTPIIIAMVSRLPHNMVPHNIETVSSP